MKTSNTARFEELMKFKNEFNEKLKESFEKYESRVKLHNSDKNKKYIKIKKNPTSEEFYHDNFPILNKNKKSNKVEPLTPKNFADDSFEYKMPKRSISQINEGYKTWKPQYMICDFFDKFRILKDGHEINDWEKVII